jgi:fatty acyl-CoA reductase
MHAVVVEKILRVQPDVKKLYLLVRAPNDAATQQRVLHEICTVYLQLQSLHLHAYID